MMAINVTEKLMMFETEINPGDLDNDYKIDIDGGLFHDLDDDVKYDVAI